MILDYIKTFLLEGSEFKTLRDNKIPLTDEEREECMKAGAVWHHGSDGKETCAIWKSKWKDGRIVYGSNTHRAFSTSPTLKGAIKKFDFIKTTA